MIQSRELVRKPSYQKYLDKYGHFLIKLLNTKNYEFLNNTLKANYLPERVNSQKLQELINGKLQSKIEYQLINCLPVFYEISEAPQFDSHEFIINQSIVDENYQKSICIIIPLFNDRKETFTVSLLEKTHLSNTFPRVSRITLPNRNYITRKDKTLKYGECMFFYNDLPYKVWSNSGILYLKIDAVPYERRILLFKESKETVRAFAISEEKFVIFKLKENFDTKNLRKIKDFKKNDIASIYSKIPLKSEHSTIFNWCSKMFKN